MYNIAIFNYIWCIALYGTLRHLSNENIITYLLCFGLEQYIYILFHPKTYFYIVQNVIYTDIIFNVIT